MEAATSVKGNLPERRISERSVPQASDPLQAIQTALINARAAQALARHPTCQPSGWRFGLTEQRTEYERQNDQEQKGDFGSNTIMDESEYLGRERKSRPRQV